ncbi:MAG: two component regulator three y domain-containing protein [Cellulophaga sp.]|nr:two component regulator three y domain-containing protein [Cellulophaga sp.]
MLQKLKNFCVFFSFVFCFSQELPPINNYTPLAYNAGNQNWSVSQSDQKHIYVANNFGLLEYNGAFWKTYASPNGSTIRAVKAVADRIYTGCYMEFGFWKKDSYGDLKYESLKPKLKTPMIEDEEFWNILHLDKWVLFQSLQRIYVYNTQDESFNIIKSESTRARIFLSDGVVYFQQLNKGIFKIENGHQVLVSADPVFKNNIIIGLFENKKNKLILTEKSGFYILANDTISKWDVPINKELSNISLYSSLQLKDKSFILGTISDGIFHVDVDGNVIERINQKKGLYDNTVHAIFEDVESNIWLALNNGISVINLISPFNEYIDKIGKLGVVYAAANFQDYLYLGTNQGLFYKQKNSDQDFKIIENTNGQVWFLKEINNTLFCGHNDGTFSVEKDKASLISEFPGAWGIKKIPNNNALLIQGNYKGLSVFNKVNNQWVFRNIISGFEISSRFFEFTTNNDLIVNHEFKGLFRLSFDKDFTKVTKVVEKPLMGSGASLVKYKDTILYTSNNGVFKYYEGAKEFKRDSLFSALFFSYDEKPIGIIVPDPKKNLLWGFTDKNIISVAPNKFNGSSEGRKIAVPSFFSRGIGVQGFENITPIEKDKYLIGISNGYLILDLNKLKTNTYNVELTHIYNKSGDSTALNKVELNNKKNEFNFKDNNLYFEFSVPNYDKYAEVSYQYQLEGFSNTWSEWSTAPEVSFENLPFGNYVFNVRAKVGNSLTKKTATFSFHIKRPWYFSNVAIFLYLLFIGISGFIIHRLYRRYYHKQQQLLLKESRKKLKRKKNKAEKKLVLIKNEKLHQDIESKSRELAISTMSIIKKNEFLNTIKSQLEESTSSTQINRVIKTIDKNINNEDDWKFFEDAFNNADTEFLKKTKQIHPDLKPNDLRLCAYLRLNLSSKEIAPLLNISVRSVEVKRYRLRKKLDLPHESNLTDYILNL